MGNFLINTLRIIHLAGYVYNDIKLDNIMTSYADELPDEFIEQNCFEKVNLHLIDFGFATRYSDKVTGKLLPKKEVENFRGNMVFGS